jgi:hypothetical protein
VQGPEFNPWYSRKNERIKERKKERKKKVMTMKNG